MEGIPVKISEKYKPPRKITLPASVQNKLNTVPNFEKYDFGLERYVVEQMGRLREGRQNGHQKEERRGVEVKRRVEGDDSAAVGSTSGAQDTILTPVPSTQSNPVSSATDTPTQQLAGINISDFENDTSSPFDFVELKTLNDMEELASLLVASGPARVGSPPMINGATSWGWTEGTAYPLSPPSAAPPSLPPPPTSSFEQDVKKVGTADVESYNIVAGLQRHLEERRLEESRRQAYTELPPTIVTTTASESCGTEGEEKTEGGCTSTGSRKGGGEKRSKVEDPIGCLSGAGQLLARRLAEMGFPPGRAARAVRRLGNNEAKVIEFLLLVQSLEEEGEGTGELVERALLACNMSPETARPFISSVQQILRLGFEEEQVIAALLTHHGDRDKALDSLIS